jgi:hypothetical protein
VRLFTAEECFEQFYPRVLAAVRALGPTTITLPTFEKKPLGPDGIGAMELQLVAGFKDGTELVLHRRERLIDRRRGHVLGSAVDLSKWERLYYILHYVKEPGGGSDSYYFGTHRHRIFEIGPDPIDHIHHASYPKAHDPPSMFVPDLLDVDPLTFVGLVRQFRAGKMKSLPLGKKP